VSIEPEIKYEGIGGDHLLVAPTELPWGAWGPGPLPPPQKKNKKKSGPGYNSLIIVNFIKLD